MCLITFQVGDYKEACAALEWAKLKGQPIALVNLHPAFHPEIVMKQLQEAELACQYNVENKIFYAGRYHSRIFQAIEAGFRYILYDQIETEYDKKFKDIFLQSGIRSDQPNILKKWGDIANESHTKSS